jgi:hypothetical protein
MNEHGFSCDRCGRYLEYIHCPNARCGSQIVFGPLIDRIYEMLQEEGDVA